MRFPGHCWRSKEELAGDVLLLKPTPPTWTSAERTPKKNLHWPIDGWLRMQTWRTTNCNGRQRKVEGACHGIPSKLDLMMMMTMNTEHVYVPESSECYHIHAPDHTLTSSLYESGSLFTKFCNWGKLFGNLFLFLSLISTFSTNK